MLVAQETSLAGFNPRSGHATGATLTQNLSGLCRIGFNPRSGHATGATAFGGIVPPGGVCFNPRSGHATGATQVLVFNGTTLTFQSALRSRDRSDGLNGWTAYTYPGFNPRSGHATGATPQNSTDRPAVIVSIRAPVTRPERLKTDALNLTTALFQSALRSRDRSDSFSLSLVQR